MSLGLNIQRAFIETERTLTTFSMNPLAGSPFGVVRVVLGAGQLSVALITGILAGISVAAFSCNKNILDHSIVHIKHGIKNIILGVIGTIPLVQMILVNDYFEPPKCNGYYHAMLDDAKKNHGPLLISNQNEEADVPAVDNGNLFNLYLKTLFNSDSEDTDSILQDTNLETLNLQNVTKYEGTAVDSTKVAGKSPEKSLNIIDRLIMRIFN